MLSVNKLSVSFKFISVLLLGVVLYSCQQPSEDEVGGLLIKNVSIVDPISGLLENQSVLIQGNQIKKVGQEIDASGNTEVIDGSGKFLIPGLWDAHVHFAFIEEIAPKMPNLFLGYGITSVRDTGGEINFVNQWKNESLKNPATFPRVKIAGPLLDGMPNVYDGSDHSHPPLSVGHQTIDDLTETIGLLDSLGVDLLKAYEMLTEEQFMQISQLAKEKQLPVTGHVPLSMDVISVSNAGLGGIEHLRNIEMSCASNWEELLIERRLLLEAGKDSLGGVLRSSIHAAQRIEAIKNYDEEVAAKVIAALRANNTYQIPTISLISGLANRHFADPGWIQSFQYLPDSIANTWTEGANRFAQSPTIERFTLHDEWSMMMIKKMYESDVPFMAGTDTPILFATPGLSLHKELSLLVEAGFSPIDALKTATTNPAAYFGMEDELGQVKEGMMADLVLLSANPLDDINNTTKINGVIKDGNYMDRDELNSLLKSPLAL